MSYGKIVPRVVMAHVALLGLLVLVPLLRNCTWFKKPPVETIQIDLSSLPPPPPPPEGPEPDEDPQEDVIPEETPIPTPRPAPTATPASEPTARPTPKPTATPRPAPTPTPKRSYLTPEEIRRRIQSQNQPVEPPPAAPTLSPEEIRDMIGGGLPSGPGVTGIPTGTGGGNVNFGGVADVLYKKLYSAWVQPRVGGGVSAAVEVVVGRDGRILSSRFVTRSGVEEFDQSVQSALSSVSTAKPLPPDFEGSSKAFEIEFELSR